MTMTMIDQEQVRVVRYVAQTVAKLCHPPTPRQQCWNPYQWRESPMLLPWIPCRYGRLRSVGRLPLFKKTTTVGNDDYYSMKAAAV